MLSGPVVRQPQMVHMRLPSLLHHCAWLCTAGNTAAKNAALARPSHARPHAHRKAQPHSAAAVAAASVAAGPKQRSKRQRSAQQLNPAGLQPGQMAELECESLAFGGQGVCRLADNEQSPELAHLQGFVILTHGAIPGERLTARIHHMQKGHAVAGKVATLRASPDAAQPPCLHFGACGGCQHQNLRYSAQLAAKQSQVSAALQRIARVPDIAARMRPIIGAPQQYHYRNKMEFTFGGQTWVPTDDGLSGAVVPAAALGFVRPGHPDQVLPIDSCWLQDAVANDILAAIRDGITAAQLLPLGSRPQAGAAGFLQRVAIRQGTCPDTGAPQHMVHLTTGAAPDAASRLVPLVAALRARCPSVVSVVRTTVGSGGPQKRRPRRGGATSGLAASSTMEVLWGQPSISQKLGGLRFDISARAFFQTNAAQAAALTELVVSAADVCSSDTVLDLFCGAGFFALALAPKCRAVHGFEVSPAAVADAHVNAATNGIGNATFQQADLDRGMPPGGPSPDIVVADPGRRGMSQALLAWLAVCGARRIVYVSCNPATQARDLAFLLGTAPDAPQTPQYRLQHVQACDLFPQTSHIESMAVLEHVDSDSS